MITLILIRGCPGSGKTTLAKKLVENSDSKTKHFEADQYFTDASGNYKWDGMKIGEAHERCQSKTKLALYEGHDTVVSNTFTRLKEMKPYFDMAHELGVQVQVITCQGEFKDIHDLPERVSKNMKNRFEYNVTPLFDSLNRESYILNIDEEGMVVLPPAFCEKHDWRENDMLKYEVITEGIRISNNTIEERKILETQ